MRTIHFLTEDEIRTAISFYMNIERKIDVTPGNVFFNVDKESCEIEAECKQSEE